jgi:hypothetical protein
MSVQLTLVDPQSRRGGSRPIPLNPDCWEVRDLKVMWIGLLGGWWVSAGCLLGVCWVAAGWLLGGCWVGRTPSSAADPPVGLFLA